MAQVSSGRFFYGYVVLIGAWLAMFVCAGAQFSFSVFFPALLDEFGWTRGMISLGFTLNVIIGPIFGLLGGYLVDRIGPRRTVIIGAVIGGIGIALLSTVTQIWHFILFYGVLAPIGISLAYWVATVSTVRRWFMRRAALMVSIAMAGSGLGIVVLVPVANGIIGTWGWRTGYIAFGLIITIGAVIAGLLLKRDPESAGTFPDGMRPSEAELNTRVDFATRAEKWSIGEVFKTARWWLFICAQFGYAVAELGLLGHLITWGSIDVGIPLGTMVAIYSSGFVLAAVFGRLFGGFISDWYMARFRWSRKPILYFNTLGVALGIFLCPLVNNTLSMTLVSILLGFSYGIGLAVYATYLGDLFGVVNLSVLLGIAGLFTGCFAALGPVLYGFCYDITGSYNAAFITTGILCVLSAICLFLIRPPRKKTAENAVMLTRKPG